MADFGHSTNTEAVQIGLVSGTNTNNFWLNKRNDPDFSHRALYFTNMNQRLHQISNAAPQTMEWIWSTSFAKWLERHDDGLFWISGKPASGKSTLMKHLASTRKTLSLLPVDKKRWVRIHFYFDFRAGGETSNTILGMWRSLAFQLAEKLPETQHCFDSLTTSVEMGRLSSDDLKERIQRAIETADASILALIDGLDEYAGSLIELAQCLINLGDHTGMKICLASRPEGPLIAFFQGYPFLRMQDHNGPTIRSYLDNAVNLRRDHFRTIFPTSLRDRVVDDAKGVVLWARLAVDHLLDGCDEGLGENQLERRLDDLPRELEELYQRILDKIESKEQSEIALICHFVTEDRDYTRLDCLYGTWLFLFQKADLGFVSVSLKDPAEFEYRLLALFGGLLDITEASPDPQRDAHHMEGFKVVSLIHKTVQSFLKRSDWVWKKLPHAFQQRYPDSPWLRVYASVIEGAAGELNVSRQDVAKCLDEDHEHRWKGRLWNIQKWVEKTSFSQSWHGWPSVVPFAIDNILNLARREENDGRSTFELISKAIDTNLISLHIASYQYGPCPECDNPYVGLSDLNMVRSDSLSLMFGVSHSLLGYVHGRLQNGPTLSSDEITILLDLALINAAKLPNSQESKMTTLVFRHYHQSLQSRHLCIVFDFAQKHSYFDMSRLGAIVSRLGELAQQPGPWPWNHHPACEIRGKQCGPLYHWACLNTAYFWKTDVCYFLQTLLALVLNTHEEINGPCYSTGHVLYAILDYPVSNSSSHQWSRLAKFLLAIKAGADPQINFQTMNIIAHARKLQRHLFFIGAKKSRSSGLKEERQDVNAIVDILKDHKRTGKWTVFDHHYDKMVATAARSRSISKAEAEAELAFSHQDRDTGIDSETRELE